MITRAELHRQAAKSGVRVELQERDYVLGWFLLGLAQVPSLWEVLVFKGGTALRKAYFPAFRFSEDLDFTVARPVAEDELREGVEAVCRQVYGESGLRMEVILWRQTRLIAEEEAYSIRIAYWGPLGQFGREPSRIRLDLTLYERLILPAVMRPISHPYPDLPAATRAANTYRLEEMLSEKLRTLLSRCYPRDLYDVWHLMTHQGDHLDRTLSLSALREKCRFKGYSYSSADDFLRSARRPGIVKAWDTSLRHLASPLPHYGAVMADLQILLPQWLEQEP